ncbi:MAG: hypothetical protein H7320_14945 [Ferruginibacter sp.]|nr:hypothetical protein [Ferruginibacter sp.]
MAKIYIGFGYHLDWINKINDEKLDTMRPFYTSHYIYSKKYGFDETHYLTSEVRLNASLGTRDNLVNAYKGVYANINWRLMPEYIGNKKQLVY